MPERDLVSIGYVADRCRVTVHTVSKWCQRGEIPHHVVRGAHKERAAYVFDRSVVEQVRESRFRAEQKRGAA